VGALLIIVAVLSLTGGVRARPPAGTGRAIVTGVLIAAYTLGDKYAVSILGLAPLLYLWAVNMGEALFMCPLLRTRASEVKTLWREHLAAVLIIAIASPAAYLLILLALKQAPVSFIAPAREVSVVMGAAMGSRMLSEGHALRRMVAAAMIVAGFAAMAVG
jgi:drug/metabolite transporter (DMT)-like permease